MGSAHYCCGIRHHQCVITCDCISPDCALQVSVLSLEGLTGSVAKWQSHRYAHVWRGRLYLTAHKDDSETLLTKTYWMAYRVVQLQPKVTWASAVVSWAGEVAVCMLSYRVNMHVQTL